MAIIERPWMGETIRTNVEAGMSSLQQKWRSSTKTSVSSATSAFLGFTSATCCTIMVSASSCIVFMSWWWIMILMMMMMNNDNDASVYYATGMTHMYNEPVSVAEYASVWLVLSAKLNVRFGWNIIVGLPRYDDVHYKLPLLDGCISSIGTRRYWWCTCRYSAAAATMSEFTLHTTIQENLAEQLLCLKLSMHCCLLFREPLGARHTEIRQYWGVVNIGQQMQPYLWHIQVLSRFGLLIDFLHFYLPSTFTAWKVNFNVLYGSVKKVLCPLWPTVNGAFMFFTVK